MAQYHHGHSHHHHHPESLSYPKENYGAGAKWIKHLTQNRLGTFNGGHFSDVNLSSVLYIHRIDNQEHVKLEVWSAPGLTKPSFEEAMKQKFRPARKGENFGPSWTNHWFKVSLTIPTYWEQYEQVQFEFDPDCEAMIFTTDGTPLQGITGGWGGDRRVEYIIPREAVKAGKHEFVIESSCNGMFGVPWNGDTIAPPDMNRFFGLRSADLVVLNLDAWHLLWDFQTLREITDNIPGNTALQNKALTVANEIMNVFDKGDVGSINHARKLAEEVFGEDWDKKGDKIYEEGAKKAQVWGIGHCHIDTAWLWPYRVTQQKVARSWSTQVDLMERYPEHRFTCSQAQQYKWLEQLYPPLFERVKEKIKEGKFHPVGGSWVENDSNMPSGEALARQFILGQRYFESRFGVRCKTAWLPDSFGLTGALPQLIRLADMDYFFTQKLSWNNSNNFPHSTFNWVGIDGTQVLCHMTPVDTYTAQATVGDVKKGVENHKNLESSGTSLLVFGNGDGGGGPLAKMLENLRRIRATSNHSRDIPPVNMGHSVDEFFDVLSEDSNAGAKLPNWSGELYLEFHRGTYTSHGSIKKGNRKSEILLRDVEILASFASLFRFHKTDYVYPNVRINDCWEKVLLNQFHDVLPGSAIGMVYDDAEKLYAEVRKEGEALIEEAFKAIFPSSVSLTDPTFKKKTGTIVGYNTTFFPRRDIVEIPLTGAASKLRSQVVQSSKDGSVGLALMDCTAGGGVAFGTGMYADCKPVSVTRVTVDHFVLKNSSVQLTIADGRISSLYDVALERELIPTGETGGLVIFDDRPNYWDAWDVEIHHLEKFRKLKFENVSIAAEGPLRASLKANVKYGQSDISVLISLDAIPASLKKNSRSFFRFDAQVDWHQRHEFLKFELPLNIKNDYATYETQFGHVQRPTHKNTTWDMAKFEVCGHKYADLSEYGYGVAILSESKYGFSCRGNVLRISLLRAATAPDAEQDQGKHEFSWAVMPHQGSFLESDVPIAAIIFNSPLHVRLLEDIKDVPLLKTKPAFLLEGAPNVFLETVKRGLDDNFEKHDASTIVLRLYEAYGGHGSVKLKLADHLSVVKVLVTNLLEDELEELSVYQAEDSSSIVKLNFHGFEVKTIKLVLGPKSAVPKRESWVTVEKPSFI
ncbi:glycoside hydrolase family 38 protein [Dichomitus squalens LYAD-421 SS1]|uniref:Alpha-mannosidase n=1 Tax=Dichomitus squalens (strain LYAD-421) TaxID=732165 RepID=R7SVA2_DICSQ|nr:glycoside hydrolase family 38 protein [Dichomitus squalens LYAD-421 SS1]EJF58912.1 glycoside hydrolase family 38 protein [Dichomitus squalens LYAD-421 SS1]